MNSQSDESSGRPNLDVIDAGLDLIEKKTARDSKDDREIQDIERDQKTLEHDLFRERIQNLIADRKLRDQYASKIIRFLYIYALVAALFCIADAVTLDPESAYEFELADEVVLTIVGSTAVAAIGLVGFVARGLFLPPKD